MKMDRRLSNGLAWAGALLVIGIPAADYLTGTFADTRAPSVAVVDAEPVEAEVAEAAAVVTPTASKPAVQVAEVAKPAPKPQAATNTSDPVDGYLQSGRELPSYITGGDTASVKPAQPAAAQSPAVQAPKPAETVATTPAPAATTPNSVGTTPAPTQQVAALPAKVAPIPMPLSMRPQPVTVPLAADQPLIIDGPAGGPVVRPPPQQSADFVTSEDLEDWESGPLSEFLARRNQQSSATYRVQQNPSSYDPDGFWLDQGPRGDRPIGRYPPDDDVYYLPF